MTIKEARCSFFLLTVSGLFSFNELCETDFMITRILLALSLLGANGALAANITYKVMYPNHEFKDFTIEERVQKVDLGKSKWSCTISEERKSGALLTCSLLSKYGVATVTNCDGEKAVVNAVQLDEGKNSYKILIACAP